MEFLKAGDYCTGFDHCVGIEISTVACMQEKWTKNNQTRNNTLRILYFEVTIRLIPVWSDP